jgi:hypothetical protein
VYLDAACDNMFGWGDYLFWPQLHGNNGTLYGWGLDRRNLLFTSVGLGPGAIWGKAVGANQKTSTRSDTPSLSRLHAEANSFVVVIIVNNNNRSGAVGERQSGWRRIHSLGGHPRRPKGPIRRLTPDAWWPAAFHGCDATLHHSPVLAPLPPTKL